MAGAWNQPVEFKLAEEIGVVIKDRILEEVCSLGLFVSASLTGLYCLMAHGQGKTLLALKRIAYLVDTPLKIRSSVIVSFLHCLFVVGKVIGT